MINILSIRCALAFAPYLAESQAEYLDKGSVTSRVARQGGTGLIIRSDDTLLLHHQNREAALSTDEARHYRATIDFRIGAFEIKRMQDEVVLANFGRDLVISFPQSEIWIEADHVSEIVRLYREAGASHTPANLPDWLRVSASAGRLLISDQSSGRWVLLGPDHLTELERRISLLAGSNPLTRRLVPPVIPLKGINVHLQSAFRLADSFERFASTGEVAEFEDAAPHFSLTVTKSTEGVEIRDFERRAALTKREAIKWADIIRAELERLSATEVVRGQIRTVCADGDRGRWVLQAGDEVFAPVELLQRVRSSQSGLWDERAGELSINRTGEFFLMLSRATGAAVALTQSELTFF